MFFISHSKEKTVRGDNGQEQTQISLALPDRAFNIINKMVDIIAYLRQVEIEENDEVKQKRYLFFRGDNRFYAGSRFAYIVPYIELSYENLVKAINDAVDEQVKRGKGEASDVANPYYELDYENLMNEAKVIWTQLINKGITDKGSEILSKTFGRPIKFSEIPDTETEKLFQAISEIKELL